MRPDPAALSVAPWSPGRRRRVVITALGFSLHQVCEALVPVTVGLVIDAAVTTGDVANLAGSLTALGLVFVVLMFSWRWGELTAMTLYAHTSYGARRTLTASLLAPHPAPGRRPAEALSVLESDVDEASAAVWTVGHAVASVIAIITATTALFFVSPLLAVVVPPACALFFWLLRVLAGRIEQRSAVEQQALATSSAVAGDLLTGLRVISGLSAQHAARERFRRANDGSLQASLRAARAESAHAGLTTLFSGVFVLALAGVAAAMLADGRLTVGEVVAVLGLAQFLQSPVESVGHSFAALARARASARRVYALAPTAEREAPVPATTSGRITVPGFGLDFAGGSVLGVSGGDADGDAIIAALAGRPSPTFAEAFLDGRPVRPGEILVLPRETNLFDGSVADNIVLWGEAVTSTHRGELERAAALADVLGPGGWDRPVGERGRLLSGGQRERVGIARALHARAAVLVLREPTAALDTVTTVRVAAGIRAARAGLTTVIFTRDPVVLAACDRTVFLDAQDATGVSA